MLLSSENAMNLTHLLMGDNQFDDSGKTCDQLRNVGRTISDVTKCAFVMSQYYNQLTNHNKQWWIDTLGVVFIIFPAFYSK